MKKIKITILVIIAVLFFLIGCSSDDGDDDDNVQGDLLILQAYGNAGDDSPAGVSHSFVELYNISNKAINLNGISLYYANGIRGEDIIEDGPWQMTALNGKIPAKGSFLVLGAKHGDLGSTRYKIADDYGDINDDNLSLNRRGFKVALIKSKAQLTVQNPYDTDGNGKVIYGYIDMVGALNNPNADPPDHIFGFEEYPARNSASEAVRRRDLTDTDNNLNDFIPARYALTGEGAFTKEMLEVRKPRNSSEGSWDPFTEPEPPILSDNTLLIFQIGAATDGNISHSFIELYNNSDEPIHLNGYSLQYAAGFSTNAGNGAPDGNPTTDGPWNKIDLSGTISPHHSFLILGTKGTNASPALSITDNSGDINQTFVINNRCFKVALISNTTLLTVQNPFDIDDNGTKAVGYIDMVGALNTSGTDYIQGCETSPITNLNKQTGQRRKSLEETDNNFADFERAVYDGATADQKEIRRPKNLAYGAWDPITGEKQ
jgi:hypothetical protein